MIETALTIAGALTTVHDVYEKVSAIIKGKKIDRYLEEILGGMRIEFERLSNRITVATNLDAVRDVTKTRQRYVEDLREVRTGEDASVDG